MDHDNWLSALEAAISDVDLNGHWVEDGFDYAYGSIEGFKSEMSYEIGEDIEIEISWTSEARACFEEMESDKTMTKTIHSEALGTTAILVRAEMVSLSAKKNGWSGYKWTAKYAVSNA